MISHVGSSQRATIGVGIRPASRTEVERSTSLNFAAWWLIAGGEGWCRQESSAGARHLRERDLGRSWASTSAEWARWIKAVFGRRGAARKPYNRTYVRR